LGKIIQEVFLFGDLFNEDILDR